jgi:hypothetical protein
MRFMMACLGSGFVILFSILLSSCATTTTNYYTQTIQSWRGGNVKTLLQRFGRADSRIMAGNGNMLLIYKTENYHTYNTTASPTVGVHFNSSGKPIMTSVPNTNPSWNRSGALSLTCSAGFEVDKHGTIVDTQVQGNGCYGDENFASKWRNPGVKGVARGSL